MWEIFALERREVVDETERRKIHNRMMYLLTGDRQYQKDSQAIGRLVANHKRTQRKYRKRGAKGFDRRKDHSINLKKKRRASAQKADISIESEQEQPLMVEQALKADDDAPMDVDQIRQEEADTAVMQEDDRGSEYNIDDYLDDHSKHSLITFTIL
jgi:hypothetical protein